MVHPAKIAQQLRDVADELESNSGNIRWVCCVFATETPCAGLPPGGHILRLSRDGVDPAELAKALQEATSRVGNRVIPVS